MKHPILLPIGLDHLSDFRVLVEELFKPPAPIGRHMPINVVVDVIFDKWVFWVHIHRRVCNWRKSYPVNAYPATVVPILLYLSEYNSRSRARARDKRDFTVPTGISRISATAS